MGTLIIAAVILGGGYLLLRGGGLSAITGQTTPGQYTPPRPGEPGYVTLGSSPAGQDWTPQPGMALKATSLTGTGVGLASGLGLGSSGGIVGGSTFGASGTALGSAIPLIGIGVAVVGTVLGLISKHHQEALANEGKVLNSALPRALNAMILVAQAVVQKEVTSESQAKILLDQIVKDYYNEVKPIVHGNWPYTGQDMTADYVKVWKQRFQPPKGAPGYSDYHAPDPCNAACVIGHFFAERNSFVVLYAVRDILAGRHGTLILPEVPKYETQAGFPEVRMIY